jgi:hypothetical protein
MYQGNVGNTYPFFSRESNRSRIVIPHPTFTVFSLSLISPTYRIPRAPPRGIVVSSPSFDDKDDEEAQKFSRHHECPTPMAFTFFAFFTTFCTWETELTLAIEAPTGQLYKP